MARLVREMRSDAFLNAHPALQAAYAHYGLVVIHPFADGNGRVARALASAFTYRAISMPIVILSEHKNVYLDALERSDNGDYQAFVDFMVSRSLETVQLVDESVRSALMPSIQESSAAISGLYVTKGGYTHDQVDEGGSRLINALKDSIERSLSTVSPKVTRSIQVSAAGYKTRSGDHRPPMNNMGLLAVSLNSASPAVAQVTRQYHLWLPRNAAGSDDILVMLGNQTEQFGARMEEVVPAISGILQIRINMFGDRVARETLIELRDRAGKALRA
jgi:hypothetical protein